MLPQLVNPFAWWQWLVLAAVPPAIIALYFLKLKRRPVEVPSTYLWHKSIEDLHVNTVWQRLRRNLLLFLQLLVLLLVLWSVLQPGWQSEKLPGHRFIFLVDNSASMQATDVEPSRLAEAKRQAVDLIDQMESGDVGMVVSFNEAARVEQSFTDNRRQLRRAVDAIQPSVRSTSLAEALKVASGLANPPRISDPENELDFQVAEPQPATLVILSDGKFEEVSGLGLGNLDPVYRPIGSPDARNVGIVTMSVGRHETKSDQLQVFARLQNFSHQPASVTLELLLDQSPIDYDRPEIPAESSRSVAFDLKAIDLGRLHLRARTGDHLARDDEAWVVLHRPRQARVLLVTPGNPYLRIAMDTGMAAEIARVNEVAPAFLDGEQYRQQATIGAYDLVIYDRCQPGEMPRANTLFIGRLPPAGGWETGPEVPKPHVIDIDPAHPLTQWINLTSVVIADGTPLRPPPGGRVLIDSHLGPLLAIAPREGFEDAVLGFVLLDSRKDADGTLRRYLGTDWPRTRNGGFPNFMLNVLQYLGGGQAAAAEGSYRPGQQVPLENPVSGKPLAVRTPGGNVVELAETPSGRFSFTDTMELGIYETAVEGKAVGQFAVSLLDAAESDIATRPDIQIDRVPVQGNAAPEARRLDIWRGLLLGGLAVLLLEWYIYSRRVSM